MKVYVFEGSYELEVIAARSEEEAWAMFSTHNGTSGLPDPVTMREWWRIEKVFDPSTMTEPECIAHYSG